MRFREGQKHGPYRLENRVGDGGQAQVWLAVDESRKNHVALKLLVGPTPAKIRVFEREAQLASALRSPHTIRILDAGVTDDSVHFIAMEHLVGHDLDEMVKLFGPTVPSHASHLVKQACLSLEEAHAMELVHRDVKPSNLFASENGGQRDIVKLLDFGVARSTAEDTDQTSTAVRGTPTYMSPEVCRGVTPAAAADIYALGATLYFLVTGTPPFVGDTFQVIQGHRQNAPERPSQRLGRELPADFEAVILRCLAKEPADRYASAADLRAALEACHLPPWTPEEAKQFWEHEKNELVRRWTDKTIV